MAFIHWQDNAPPTEATQIERGLCVAAVVALPSLPFALCVALTICGSCPLPRKSQKRPPMLAEELGSYGLAIGGKTDRVI